nr:STAS domain-containing protein [Lysinibacillus timonensis]
MEMSIHFREEGNLLSVFVMGEIDTFTAPKLRDKLDSIEINNFAIIELDLSEVVYMDSTSLGVIVAFYKKVTRTNSNFKIVGLSARLKRLFVITGLSELMDIDVGEKGGIGL